MLVLALTSTSSPGPTPAARTASCSAVVPLVTATRAGNPRTPRTRSRSRADACPKEPEISPRRERGDTASMSASPMSGSKTGINALPRLHFVLGVAEEWPLLDADRLHVFDYADRVRAVDQHDGVAGAQDDLL